MRKVHTKKMKHECNIKKVKKVTHREKCKKQENMNRMQYRKSATWKECNMKKLQQKESATQKKCNMKRVHHEESASWIK